jgi:D-arabinose 1-dehydrogenase-like Zn-dependent alcohol dehydrogenase
VFDGHVRKSEVISGIDTSILDELPSYKPGNNPTVPGHEVFCTIVSSGNEVSRHKLGEKVLVQTDYRWLKTADSNSAFGYNIEGGLQEYVLMDERVIVDPNLDESFLLPVEKDMSSSSIALVEPWACVECSYVTEERNTILAGSRLLVVADSGRGVEGLEEGFSPEGGPDLNRRLPATCCRPKWCFVPQ